jgi:hypothetical protein
MAAKNSSLRFGLCWLAFFLCCGIPLALDGCSKKTDVKSQVSELEKTFQDTSPAAPSPGQRPLASQPVSSPGDARAYVSLALSAVRTNDFAGGVIALQAAQRRSALTPAQHRAVYQAMQAMTADLLARAANGDARAKADLAAIEKTRSQ